MVFLHATMTWRPDAATLDAAPLSSRAETPRSPRRSHELLEADEAPSQPTLRDRRAFLDLPRSPQLWPGVPSPLVEMRRPTPRRSTSSLAGGPRPATVRSFARSSLLPASPGSPPHSARGALTGTIPRLQLPERSLSAHGRRSPSPHHPSYSPACRTLPNPQDLPAGWAPIINLLRRQASDAVLLTEDGTLLPAILDAAADGDASAVHALLDAGVKVNTSYRGVTPLMAAAITGQGRLVDLLLRRGAEVDLQLEPTGGRTALMAACVSSQPLVVERLLSAGAKLDMRNEEGRRAIDELAEAAKQRVLSPRQFVHCMRCTNLLMEQQHHQEMARLVPQPAGGLTPRDDEMLDEWRSRVHEARQTLHEMIVENVRRGTDHETKFTNTVRDASAHTAFDMAGKWASRKMKQRAEKPPPPHVPKNHKFRSVIGGISRNVGSYSIVAAYNHDDEDE